MSCNVEGATLAQWAPHTKARHIGLATSKAQPNPLFFIKLNDCLAVAIH